MFDQQVDNGLQKPRPLIIAQYSYVPSIQVSYFSIWQNLYEKLSSNDACFPLKDVFN